MSKFVFLYGGFMSSFVLTCCSTVDLPKEYFEKNKSVASLKDLAEDLKMRLVTIRGDFNRFNLYSQFEVEKKDSLFNEV